MISFNDVREAKQAYVAIQYSLPRFNAVVTRTSQELAAYRQDASDPLCFLFEGQVMVYAYFDQGAVPPVGANETLAAMRRLFDRFGEVRAILSLPFRQNSPRQFIVEFYNVQASAALINFTQGGLELTPVSGLPRS